jgi:hypothetical protein
MITNSLYYLASVSKSLLTVIGTLAVSWVGYNSAPTARGAGYRSPHSLRRYGAGYAFRFPLSCKFYGIAVCPCQGTWREALQLRLCVTSPISDCLAWRRSLDNSCPPSRSSKSSGKTKNIFWLFLRTAVLLPSVLACAQLHPDSRHDRMRASGQGITKG